MNCCCIQTLNLCKKPVCGSIEFDLQAELSGVYKLVLDYLDNQISVPVTLTSGDDISFDVSGLNENFEYTGNIVDPNGNVLPITINEIEYDCIKFRTIINISSEGEGTTGTVTEPVAPGTYKVGTTSGAPTAGEFTWTLPGFANNYVRFAINGSIVYQNDVGDGSAYLTKSFASDTLTIHNYPGGWQDGDVLNII